MTWHSVLMSNASVEVHICLRMYEQEVFPQTTRLRYLTPSMPEVIPVLGILVRVLRKS